MPRFLPRIIKLWGQQSRSLVNVEVDDGVLVSILPAFASMFFATFPRKLREEK